METGKTEVIAGVNLPMLIKLASVRGEKPLNQAITDAQDAGRKYINVASQVLNRPPWGEAVLEVRSEAERGWIPRR
jgi:mannose/fructose-specific phosphotransferase system component IIA